MAREAVEHDAIAAADDRAVVEAVDHHLAPGRPRKARVTEQKVGAEAHVREGLQSEACGVVDGADALPQRQGAERLE